MKHYHVMGGQHGCIPDFNYTFENQEDAIQELKYKYEEVRSDENFRIGNITGSYKQGYYLIRNMPGFWDYVEMVDCQDDCDLDNEY